MSQSKPLPAAWTIEHLHRTLKEGTYRPQAIRRVHIPKPGRRQKRPLGIPTVRDRVVQTALKQVLEPIFERDFAEQSYGFRPGRSCKDALGRVDALLKAGYSHIVDADLESYFDTIPHERLMDRIRSKVSDARVVSLIALFLSQGVIEGLAVYTPEAGSPQGAVISPLLSNVYLDELDHLMAAHGLEMVRYADDFVVMCRSSEAATGALDLVTNWVHAVGLKLHPDKSGIVTHEAGFDFLGYHFQGGRRWPRKKSLQAVKARIRAQTKRTSGRSLDCIIAEVNKVCVAGTRTTNTAIRGPSGSSTGGYACACARSCVGVAVARVRDGALIISVGPMPTLRVVGCLA